MCVLTAACLFLFGILLSSCNKSGSSSSNNSNPTTPQALGTPDALAAANVTDSSFLAVWQAVSGATGYQLYVAIDSVFVYPVTGYNPKSVSDTSMLVTGLTNSTPYYYKVKAVNASGTSSASNTIKLITL